MPLLRPLRRASARALLSLAAPTIAATACASRARDPLPASAESCAGARRQLEVRNDGAANVDVYYYERPASSPRFLQTVSRGTTLRIPLPADAGHAFATPEGRPEQRLGSRSRVLLTPLCTRP